MAVVCRAAKVRVTSCRDGIACNPKDPNFYCAYCCETRRHRETDWPGGRGGAGFAGLSGSAGCPPPWCVDRCRVGERPLNGGPVTSS